MLAGPGGATVLELGRADFTALLGPLQSLLEAQAAAYATPAPKITGTPKPEELTHVAVLGSGAFGRVTLVRYQGKPYALKALSKAHVLSTGLQVSLSWHLAVLFSACL